MFKAGVQLAESSVFVFWVILNPLGCRACLQPQSHQNSKPQNRAPGRLAGLALRLKATTLSEGILYAETDDEAAGGLRGLRTVWCVCVCVCLCVCVSVCVCVLDQSVSSVQGFGLVDLGFCSASDIRQEGSMFSQSNPNARDSHVC